PLTAACSTIELARNESARRAILARLTRARQAASLGPRPGDERLPVDLDAAALGLERAHDVVALEAPANEPALLHVDEGQALPPRPDDEIRAGAQQRRRPVVVVRRVEEHEVLVGPPVVGEHAALELRDV